MTDEIKYEDFREEWMVEITSGKPSTIELGRRFATKLITQWLDISADSDNIIYCDGKGDGGIDLAYLKRNDIDNNGAEGNTWYLVQSKYGSALQNADTIVREGRKIFETLTGLRSNLSSLSADLLERLQNFRKQASDQDHLVLVFATDNPLNESEMRALNHIRVLGKNEIGAIFDVRSISVMSIYGNTLEQPQSQLLSVSVKADIKDTGSNLLVGTVSLLDLYDFLKAYQEITGHLEQIYEKNVRRFLGYGRVNKAIRETLYKNPELFGLYNNGITIVVHNFTVNDSIIKLTEPFIVNGCQTTRIIWDVMCQKLEAGGTGKNADIEAWKQDACKGMVVTKIVKVGDTGKGEKSLESIARYTNSQNAVREKDFMALTIDFRNWQDEIAKNYDVYLEIQRGGIDSQKAFQKQHPKSKQYKPTAMANAFDLLKVYAAGWEGEAGTAFSKNSPFAPGGSIYEKIMNETEHEEPFGVDDLYAAYQLEKAADTYNFGRTAEKPTLRQTRFLFYMVVIDILKDVMVRAGMPDQKKNVTKALLKLFKSENQDAISALTNAAIEVVDSYLTQGLDAPTVFKEPSFKNDLNAFLKSDKLGKSDAFTPQLKDLLSITKISLV
jgi:hypothetical protein